MPWFVCLRLRLLLFCDLVWIWFWVVFFGLLVVGIGGAGFLILVCGCPVCLVGDFVVWVFGCASCLVCWLGWILCFSWIRVCFGLMLWVFRYCDFAFGLTRGGFPGLNFG